MADWEPMSLLPSFLARRRRAAPPGGPQLPGRRALSEAWLGELADLVGSGELGPAAAQAVLDDLFEPAADGEPRLVREAVWHSYLEEQAALAEIRSEQAQRP